MGPIYKSDLRPRRPRGSVELFTCNDITAQLSLIFVMVAI